MDWLLLGKALCLVVVIEGLFYALAPRGMRQAASMISRMDEQKLRSTGISAMVIGGLILFLIGR